MTKSNFRYSLIGFVSGLFVVLFLNLLCSRTEQSRYPVSGGRRRIQEFQERVWSSQPRGKLKSGRVLCWILTQPKNFSNRTKAVMATWTKQCDVTVYFSSEHHPEIPTIGLNISEGRNYLPEKSITALKYLYNHYYDQADWFLKGDDDTYIIMGNLRHFLRDKDPDDLHYYGQVFQGLYNSGGAGYVMGRKVLKTMANAATQVLQQGSKWVLLGAAEDEIVGRILKENGVLPWNESVDSLGRPLFNWNDAYGPLNNDVPAWARQRTNTFTGSGSVSCIAVSFHYVEHQDMLCSHFFLHNLTVYGHHRPVWLNT